MNTSFNELGADFLIDDRVRSQARRQPAMEHSALGEIGNVAVSHFLNAVARQTKAPSLLRPSSPTVLEGKLNTILDVIVAPAATVRDDLLMVETTFQDSAKSVQGRLLLFPDPAMTDF